MVQINMKELYHVTAKGNDYYYAWRGGPAIKGEPGSPEFVRDYVEAHSRRREPDKGLFQSVRRSYREGPFLEIAGSTKRVWTPWLDEIGKSFDPLPLRVFTQPEKVKPLIRDWRNRFAAKPRAADTGLQVLSVVIAHGIDPMGVIGVNPCVGMKRLYKSDRSEIIWLPDDIAALASVAPAEVMHAVRLAATTGLRQGDLVRLTWNCVKDDHIHLPGTSKNDIEAFIPLYGELRAVLATIPKLSPVILTNSLGKPWGNGKDDDGKHLRKAFGRAKDRWETHVAAKVAAGAPREEFAEIGEKHFHDLRGTAATKFYLAGLTVRVIAEIMAWEEETVEKIIRKYVGRKAATMAIIRQLNENGSAKPVAKLSGDGQ
jgi:integrase